MESDLTGGKSSEAISTDRATSIVPRGASVLHQTDDVRSESDVGDDVISQQTDDLRNKTDIEDDVISWRTDDLRSVLDEEVDDELKEAFEEIRRIGEIFFADKEKFVIEEGSQDHFGILPKDWVKVTHNSGVPVYLHKPSRVCSFSKPYILVSGDIANHNVPVSSIPCLNYKRKLEKETAESQDSEGLPLKNAKVETVQEHLAENTLTPDQYRKYCETAFKFKTSQCAIAAEPKEDQSQISSLPDGTCLITAAVQITDESAGKSGSKSKCKKAINPAGKSFVTILHEYTQRTFKNYPTYKFKVLEKTPVTHSAEIFVNGTRYGEGFGSSKKEAKLEAARIVLEILIPGVTKYQSIPEKKQTKATLVAHAEFFDNIKIDDPRVSELSASVNTPSPFSILITCLQRNYGIGVEALRCTLINRHPKKHLFTMHFGEYTESVRCKNKNEGKQLAAQALLKVLHPDETNWGSLLLMYGHGSIKSFKEEQKLIVKLQFKRKVNKPNYAILNHLKAEMLKSSANNATQPGSSQSQLNPLDVLPSK